MVERGDEAQLLREAMAPRILPGTNFVPLNKIIYSEALTSLMSLPNINTVLPIGHPQFPAAPA